MIGDAAETLAFFVFHGVSQKKLGSSANASMSSEHRDLAFIHVSTPSETIWD